MQKIAIIGAGLAGLVAANRLAERSSEGGYNITLFDKSRGVSGRMSTRYATPYEFDHGAQYITAETDSFSAFLAEMASKAVISQWDGLFGHITANEFRASQPSKVRYVAVDKMNTLAKHLADGLHLKLGCRIAHMSTQSDGQYRLYDEDQAPQGSFDLVISAMPQPQLLDFMAHSHLCADAALKAVQMLGCYSLMIGDDNLQLPGFDAAHISDSPLGWMAVNSRKPGRNTAPSLIVQSTYDWADAHLDDNQDWVKDQLLAAISQAIGIDISDAAHIALHRWRYAGVARALGSAFWQYPGQPVYAIGDWCLGGKLEQAYLSATALADHLQGRII